MVKTVTVTYGPTEGSTPDSWSTKHTKEILETTGFLGLLHAGGVSVDLKAESKDKAFRNKVSLWIADTTTDFTINEIVSEEDKKKLNPKIAEKIEEWLYTYVANQ